MNKYEELEKLKHLKESGALTEEEFEKEKKTILSDTPNTNKIKENKTAKPKMTTGKIIGIIILVIVIRFYHICYC